MSGEVPRVWVGCLACYNGGDLIGQWFDAEEAPEDMAEFDAVVFDPARSTASVTPANPVPLYMSAVRHTHIARAHEELWVFDHENFHGLLKGECSPSEAKRLAEILTESDEPEALALFTSDGHEAGDFDEAWCGYWDSEADYAQELAEDMGSFVVPATSRDQMNHGTGRDLSSEWPFSCIDWSHAWRELRLGGDNWSEYVPGKGYAIFRSV